jgi:ABC-type branched-subunit amino acid transport system ATPase component
VNGLEVGGVRIRRGEIDALRSVSFTAQQGDVVAVLGPNGAGKTTLVDIVSGRIAPDGGTVSWLGANLLSEASWRRAPLGVARSFQEVRLASSLSVRDHFKFALCARDQGTVWGSLLRPTSTRSRERELTAAANDLLRGHPLEEQASLLAGQLSFGQQKVLAVSCCLATRPTLALLDEPMSGLAATFKDWILGRIRDMATNGSVVVLAEHDLEATWRIASKALVLESGFVRAYGRPSEVAPVINRLVG